MNWLTPSAKEIMDVVSGTWPAAREFPCGPFILRDGKNGGKRASSATLENLNFTQTDIENAAVEMQKINQPPLFNIRDGDEKLDSALAQMGYRSFDFVTLFAAPTKILAQHESNEMNAICADEPIAAMAEIWAAGNITPARIDVMRRTKGPKTYFLGRINDTPAGAAYVAVHKGIAMVHALEVLAAARRQGLGLQLMASAASWALKQQAKTFALAVVSSNQAACGLYKRLGMTEVGNYHYRIKDTDNRPTHSNARG